MSSPCDVRSTITRSVYVVTGLCTAVSDSGTAKAVAAWPWLLSGWKDDTGLPKQQKAAPARCHLGRSIPWQVRILLMKSSPCRLMWHAEAIPLHCLEVAPVCVCVFWPLAKLTRKIIAGQYADSETTVDGREVASGTGCTNPCVPALGKGFTTLLAGLQKPQSPHWVLDYLTKPFNLNYCSWSSGFAWAGLWHKFYSYYLASLLTNETPYQKELYLLSLLYRGFQAYTVDSLLPLAGEKRGDRCS